LARNDARMPSRLPDFLDDRLARRDGAVHMHDHVEAHCGEMFRDVRADTPTGAGDEGHAPSHFFASHESRVRNTSIPAPSTSLKMSGFISETRHACTFFCLK